MTNEEMVQCVKVATKRRIWSHIRELMASNTELNHTSGKLCEPLEEFPAVTDRLENAGVVVTGSNGNYKLDWSKLRTT
ncbi:hypothetical protein [Lactiplantibacillus mudanjiangensis]|uniref:Uncharacterized protein n=1 Tax=Lactiplantibacillus mudanjiangensis TaxID=1296538 RepID=A0A660DX26_9LACO|nr:hypothetical protein [Lactiplantibacillus mudanjiangensis]VDG25728.1 hypothetical protein MUDAN_IGPPGNFN_03403 [Lactiplantibacillus mudanjiangensis]VDG27903.1 hypothetical protein MUDAN_MDHGFNIF_02720 [Lactiplantibacillus mudanjiangensis]